MKDVRAKSVWRRIATTPAPDSEVHHASVVIVGAGPVGLTLALDLARRGRKVVVISRFDYIAAGSRAICFAKRTLDIWRGLGVCDAMIARGVRWDTGKLFWRDDDAPIYQFNLSAAQDEQSPAFINIQQYLVEEILVEALMGYDDVDIRWGHDVLDVSPGGNQSILRIAAAGRSYELAADWVVACDGSRSTVRQSLKLEFEGRVFEDNFLIADIRMTMDRPSERWFWFDPPFNRGGSALLHKQPDDVWRLDFQLGWDIDRQACVKPENVERLVRAMLGQDVEFTPEWYSVYTFQCRRMERFVWGNVIFAGDAAHLVSPFGARGCNGGIADVANLGWKLDAVIAGRAGRGLIETYNEEAITIADANILHSTRSTDFMTPKSNASRQLRDAVLELARDYEFARPMVNSGRLSTAVSLHGSSLNTPDPGDAFDVGIQPGSPLPDAPIADGWLLGGLDSQRATLLANAWTGDLPDNVDLIDIAVSADPLLAARYRLDPGAAMLVRPDHYVAARWRHPTVDAIAQAADRCLGVLPPCT